MNAQQKKLALFGGIALLVVLGARDLWNKDANALARANERAGLQVDCSIIKLDGKRWGACRYKNGAPASAWLDRDGTWVAANGNAHKVIDRLASAPDLQGLPNIMQDYANPPAMPAQVFEQ